MTAQHVLPEEFHDHLTPGPTRAPPRRRARRTTPSPSRTTSSRTSRTASCSCESSTSRSIPTCAAGSATLRPMPIRWRSGAIIVGGTVCVVEESRDPSYDVGDVVLSYSGWQTHAVADARHVRKLDPSAAPISTALGVLGMPGLTAYAGLLEIGKPQPGETVVVAAATGPVGSAVGQIAKVKGARAVGIAGGPEKKAGSARRVRLRRRARPPLPHVRRRPRRGGAGRGRRLLRERRWAGGTRGLPARQPLRAGAGVRTGRGLQRRVPHPRDPTGCRAS